MHRHVPKQTTGNQSLLKSLLIKRLFWFFAPSITQSLFIRQDDCHFHNCVLWLIRGQTGPGYSSHRVLHYTRTSRQGWQHFRRGVRPWEKSILWESSIASKTSSPSVLGHQIQEGAQKLNGTNIDPSGSISMWLEEELRISCGLPADSGVQCDVSGNTVQGGYKFNRQGTWSLHPGWWEEF